LCTLEREEIVDIARFSMSNSRIQKESLDPIVSVSVSDRKYPIEMYIHWFFGFCSNPGLPFAVGMTLVKLATVTVDDNGKETFVMGGSLD
jgi:vacuolar protein sorting-associated protein 13A/C